ncbi:hypothetical protein D3C85_225420 [compost metagenome]
MSNAIKTLQLAFDRIENVVEYDEEFNNGTGYFDHLVNHETGLEVGQRFKMITPMPNNRKVIGVVTPVGNAVFFERYTGGENGIVARNIPSSFSGIFIEGSVSEELLSMAIGSAEGYNRNIGHMLKAVVCKAVGNGFMEAKAEKPADLN